MESLTALITGANKGIGFETARILGARGMTVLMGARAPERGEKAAETLRSEGLDARFVRLDVTDPETIGSAAKWIESEFGRLDVLVNNAAITSTNPDPAAGVTPSRTTTALVREAFETNVFGVIEVINALLPSLRRSESGRIVNVSSELGSLTGLSDPGVPYYETNALPYNTSKSALNAITVAYAKELSGSKITENSVTPGYCATDLNGHTGYLTPAQGAEVVARVAMRGGDGPTGAFLSATGTVPW